MWPDIQSETNTNGQVFFSLSASLFLVSSPDDMFKLSTLLVN